MKTTFIHLRQQRVLAAGCLLTVSLSVPSWAQAPNATRTLSSAERDAWPGQTPVVTPPVIRLVKQSESALQSPRSAQAGEPLFVTGPEVEFSSRPRSVRDFSRIYFETVKPAVVKEHDIVTIVVDEKSEVIMNQRFNRQKTGKFQADLKQFVRLGETGNLASAAGGSPKIDSQLTSGLNTTGTVTDQEGIKYRIAAKVTTVNPNGTIHLQAKKEIHTQDDVSEFTLTGEVRAKDIRPDNTASSENVANLQIVKRQKGRIHDSTKRGWGVKLLDLLSPF